MKHMFSKGNYSGEASLWTKGMGSFYGLKAVDIEGNKVDFSDHKGKVVLVVNVASAWGATTSSYKAMTGMYEKYKGDGLVIMGFPCNQFGGQEPKSEAEISKFVKDKFNVTFPMFSKIDVKGDNVHPVYKFLLACFPGDITWNFAAKFMVDRNGVPVARFGRKQKWEDIEAAVVAALKEAAPAGEGSEEKSSQL